MDYAAVLERVVKWATETDSVRAVLLTGSAAVGDAHPLSDRDIEIYTRDVGMLLHEDSWWDTLGEVLVVERLENDLGHPTRLIYYVGGKIDFTLISADELPTAVHTRPFRVIVDKDARAPVSSATVPAGDVPNQVEFEEALHCAYAAALMCAKAVVREELWSAKLRDNDFKSELLRMIEWDHHLRYGAGFDTRYLGTRMSNWMDADIRNDLTDCWGRFDGDDTAAALRRTVALFARLAQRVGTALGLPPFPHDRLRAEIERILETRHEMSF